VRFLDIESWNQFFYFSLIEKGSSQSSSCNVNLDFQMAGDELIEFCFVLACIVEVCFSREDLFFGCRISAR
jgi:hypothetical protein